MSNYEYFLLTNFQQNEEGIIFRNGCCYSNGIHIV